MAAVAWPDQLQPESTWTHPSASCRHPVRWHSTDDDSTEIEVTELVAGFVRGLQPDLVLETGTAWGQTAQAIGESLALNRHGRLITCEPDLERAAAARERCRGLPVDVVEQSSQDVIAEMVGQPSRPRVGFAWLDSLFDLRIPELSALRPLLAPGAVVGVHDCGEPGRAKFDVFASAVAGHALAFGFNRISLPTPRGVTFLSWH